jgi:hypothetical protein
MFRLAPPALILVGMLLAEPGAAQSTPALVANIMALLSVFDRAGALPPESNPQANAVIHALIQTQAALTKSSNLAIRRWFGEALRGAERSSSTPVPNNALTSRTLEAIVTYAEAHPPEDDRQVLAGLNEFGIGSEDLRLLAAIFGDARRRLQDTGLDIHALYATERRALSVN